MPRGNRAYLNNARRLETRILQEVLATRVVSRRGNMSHIGIKDAPLYGPCYLDDIQTSGYNELGASKCFWSGAISRRNAPYQTWLAIYSEPKISQVTNYDITSFPRGWSFIAATVTLSP